jgi:hypothetical protein
MEGVGQRRSSNITSRDIAPSRCGRGAGQVRLIGYPG